MARTRTRRGGAARAARAPGSQTVYSPVADFEGEVAGITFKKGVGTASADRSLGYFRRHGYGIGQPATVYPVGDPEILPAKVQLGTPLRDAAVDPRVRDFLPPTNAGEANPHGPRVVSPEIHHEGPKGIKPGDVHVGEPKQQEADETALAEAVLVDGDPHSGAVEPPPGDDEGDAADGEAPKPRAAKKG